jgi:hypothetical protein
MKQLQRLGVGFFVQTKPTAIVETIEPAKGVLSVDEVVELFRGDPPYHETMFAYDTPFI